MAQPRRSYITTMVGIAVALLVIFQRPLHDAIQLGQSLELRYGLAIFPGLAVLGVVFVGHYVLWTLDRAATRRRHDHASRVVAMGQALTRASSLSTLRNRLREHLPAVVGAEGVWVVIRVDEDWVALAGGRSRQSHQADAALEARADQLRERGTSEADALQPVEIDGHLCVPLTIGDHGFGVMGAPTPAAGRGDLRHRMASAVAVVGVSVRNVQLLTEIDEHSMLDGLTGCFNRTQGMKVLDAELQRAKRARSDVTLLIVDLDGFKAVNDTHGHLCGDALLQTVGEGMREALRNSDVKIRYGGDEFMVLLPDTSATGASHVAGIVHQALGKCTLSWEDQDISLTVSIGAATASGDTFDLADAEPSVARQALIARADAALYRAKRQGRDRVCIDQSSETVRSSGKESLREEATGRRQPASSLDASALTAAEAPVR